MSSRRSILDGLHLCDSIRLANGVDHLSNLHESLLSMILSRLPTKDAVRTSILSKHWRNRWTCVSLVDVKDICIVSDVLCDSESFGNFVDNVVSFTQNLQTLSLFCKGNYDLSRVTRWIYDILRCKNMERLELVFWSWSSCKEKGIVLPWSLLDSSSLEHLSLVIPNCTINVATMNYFPNLTILYLWGVQILNGNPESDTLMLNFPALEILQVASCKWVNVKFVKIYTPVLNTFSSETAPSEGPSDYSIQIFSLRFSMFKSSGGFPDNVILTGSQVNTVLLTNYYPVFELAHPSSISVLKAQVLNLWNESSRLTVLQLSDFMARSLLLGPSLRQHNELKELCFVHPTHTEVLFGLLHTAPSLKFLSVNVVQDDYDYGVEPVPSCIKSHLEEVHLHGFEGLPCQCNFVKFLLKSCRVLEKLFIYHPPCVLEECIKLQNELSMSPIISTNLKIIASPDEDDFPC